MDFVGGQEDLPDVVCLSLTFVEFIDRQKFCDDVKVYLVVEQVKNQLRLFGPRQCFQLGLDQVGKYLLLPNKLFAHDQNRKSHSSLRVNALTELAKGAATEDATNLILYERVAPSSEAFESSRLMQQLG